MSVVDPAKTPAEGVQRREYERRAMTETPDTLISTYTHSMVYSAKDVPSHMAHVRLYGSSPDACALQVRSRGKVTDHGSAIRGVVATARMGPPEARELRDALSAWIAEREPIEAHELPSVSTASPSEAFGR